MNVHPDAEVFPAMTDEEFERLADDIAANGLLEPITLLSGAILDGCHRQRACDLRGVAASYVEWDAGCGITPLEWVISRNLHRRQLTVGQRTALAVEFESRLAEAARQRKAEGGRTAGRGRPLEKVSAHARHPIEDSPRAKKSAAIAGKSFGVSEHSVAGLKAVLQKDPKVFAQVKGGEIGMDAARRLAGLNPGRGSSQAEMTKVKLKEVLDPLRRYLKNWDEQRLKGVGPVEARQLLKTVQAIDEALFEVERALEARTVVSRALR